MQLVPNRVKYGICSQSTIRTLEQRHGCYSNVFIVNFEQVFSNRLYSKWIKDSRTTSFVIFFVNFEYIQLIDLMFILSILNVFLTTLLDREKNLISSWCCAVVVKHHNFLTVIYEAIQVTPVVDKQAYENVMSLTGKFCQNV